MTTAYANTSASPSPSLITSTATAIDPVAVHKAERFLGRLSRAATKTLAAASIVVAGSFAFAMEAAAEQVRVTNLGTYSSLNLRTAPTTQSSVITRMPNGATNLNWTGNQVLNGSTLWYEVQYNGTVGWAAARYLETTNAGRSGQYASQGDYVPDYDYSYGTSDSYAYGTGTGTGTSERRVVVTPSGGTGYGHAQTQSQSNQITSDQVGAALFGLVVGGILGAVLDDDSGSTARRPPVVTPPVVKPPRRTPRPQPPVYTPVRPPAPIYVPTPPQPERPRNFQVLCSGEGVRFSYQRATGDVSLTINGRRVQGEASRRVNGNRGSFAVPFETRRASGTLFVDDIRSRGQNARLVWNGPRFEGLYNLSCQRHRI